MLFASGIGYKKNSPMLSQVIRWTNDDNIQYLFGELGDIATFSSTGIQYDSNGNCLTDLKGYIVPRSHRLFDKPQHDLFKRIAKNDYFLPAQFIIQQIINKNLDQYPVKPRLLMDKNNTLKQFFVPSSLLSCMWFQFFQVVTGERKIKQCAYCGQWENITNKYASWKYHSHCGNKARVKKHRERQKESE